MADDPLRSKLAYHNMGIDHTSSEVQQVWPETTCAVALERFLEKA